MNKRALALETLGKWIIALVILVLLVLGVMILQGKGTNLFEKIAEILRFGR